MIRKRVGDVPKISTIEPRPWDAKEVLAGEKALLPLVQGREPRPQLLDLARCESRLGGDLHDFLLRQGQRRPRVAHRGIHSEKRRQNIPQNLQFLQN